MNGIMIQGTASNVGKSLITTGLCRLFVRHGHKIAPFKAQNMSGYSFQTVDKKEIGIAQAQQAEAANITPSGQMNPVLLKMLPDEQIAFFLLGEKQKVIKGSHFKETYYQLAKETIQTTLVQLKQNYEVLILEGAGSPVEMNLKEHELANMAVAEMADVPVILVADIDRGGAFASIVGTLQLLTAKEKSKVCGIIINKFQGNIASFSSGVKWLKDYTNIPVVGVVPYLEHNLMEEDVLSKRAEINHTKEKREATYNKLADHLETYVDFEKIKAITFGEQ